MLTPDPARERPRPPAEVRRAGLLPPRLAGFRRLYRWLNLTLVHQGLWPLILVLGTTVPALSVAALPLPWFAARLAGPLLATLLALVYLIQKPAPPATAEALIDAGGFPVDRLRQQVGLLLPGLALTLVMVRLVVGPVEPAARIIGFGVADVLAFQLIHFGVVARSWPDTESGVIAAVGLFAGSWGLRELFLAAVGSAAANLPLAFGGGAVVGLLVGLLSLLLRSWPGGFWPAAAMHLMVIFLIFGFV